MPNTPNSVVVLDQFGRIPSPISFASATPLIGVTDGSAAAPGDVGEIISSMILLGAAVPVTSGAIANVASITLTPGDWDITGSVVTDPAGTTVTQTISGGISTSSAARPGNLGDGFSIISGVSTGAGQLLSVAVSLRPLNVTVATAVFLIGQAVFTVSTMAIYGTIIARRMR
jgi:hypothetical protein